ncbi:NYN domain-containing protein [Bradyrhizobium sp. ISRA464]|uniref:LabA-like NYN domain-containing protein n=1 Tax=Bradyrhizobium sp. ISRA464 TaxID=2866200 RepID=UPI00247A6BCF|nr:NYN domain-containing protein [Bradyrhizobium sp. ISRA464]WGS29779.1 NYN domain-containing protein [Bradyrhizobium sp. ISRA464]
MTDRIALFIDGANLHNTVKSLGFEVDFRRLLSEFGKHGRLVRAYFYTVVKDDGEYTSTRPLIDWLDYNGYAVRSKPAREHDDGEGRRRIKRNVGVEIAVDALEIARRIDHAFLFSGDGDLRAVVEAIRRMGVRVTVISSIRTKPPMIADELRRQADVFLELDSLRPLIERPPHPIAPE